jgi:hypothetical protein
MAMSSTAAEAEWGTFVPGYARPDPSAYGGRAARKRGRYDAFVPPNIATYDFRLTDAAQPDVDIGMAGLENLKALGLAGGLHSLAETLLRSESVASSRIEGLDISHARLARVRFGDVHEDKRARDVLACVERSTWAPAPRCLAWRRSVTSIAH